MNTKILKISAPKKPVHIELSLPASKSIANRLLIMQSFNPAMTICNVSEANDTILLQKLLSQMKEAGNQNIPVTLDAGPAGTVYRFMTARLAIEPGTWLLTGTERMKERPVKLLTDALRKLGADIEYAGKGDYPPLIIRGKKLQGGAVSIDAGVSSQYISALMMIAPALEKGLDLTLTGNVGSFPYIEMTARLMQQAGITVINKKNSYVIPAQFYAPAKLITEPDWSAASYWFQIVSLSNQSEVLLKDLKPESLQGDSAVRALFEPLGVQSQFTNEGLLLKNTALNVAHFTADFTDIPDLAQTFAVTLAAHGIPSWLLGLKSLRIKETDRINALIAELDVCGLKASESENYVLELPLQKTENLKTKCPLIHTWHDHRMAMAFAPLCLKRQSLQIENPDVVQKSYPAFWNHLQDAGFSIDVLTIS